MPNPITDKVVRGKAFCDTQDAIKAFIQVAEDNYGSVESVPVKAFRDKVLSFPELNWEYFTDAEFTIATIGWAISAGDTDTEAVPVVFAATLERYLRSLDKLEFKNYHINVATSLMSVLTAFGTEEAFESAVEILGLVSEAGLANGLMPTMSFAVLGEAMQEAAEEGEIEELAVIMRVNAHGTTHDDELWNQFDFNFDDLDLEMF